MTNFDQMFNAAWFIISEHPYQTLLVGNVSRKSIISNLLFFFGIEPDHVIGNDIGTYVIMSRDTCHLYNVVHRGGSGLYITRNFGLGIEITFSSCHPPAPDPLLIDE